MKLLRTPVEEHIEEVLCKSQGHTGAVLGTPAGPTFMCTRCGKTLEFEQPPASPGMSLVTPGA